MNNPKKVSWESYSTNPKAILENPKLVIRDGDRYFNWNTCAAVAVGKFWVPTILRPHQTQRGTSQRARTPGRTHNCHGKS